MQSTFANLALSNREWYRPSGFWKAFKDYDGEPLNVREHQDAYEFFTRLQVVPHLGLHAFCRRILYKWAHNSLLKSVAS